MLPLKPNETAMTVRHRQGQLAEGEADYREALAIRQTLGRESLETAAAVGALGGILRRGGKLDEAEKNIFERHSRLKPDSFPATILMSQCR
jgi:hypothetical protein